MGNNNIKTLTSRQAVSRLTARFRTGAGVSSPSSGVRPGARALNLELPTSFVVGLLSLLFGGLLLSHSAYAASYLNVSSSGAVSLGSIRPTSSGTSSTGSDALTVHTDCSTGYSVYVSGQNGKDTNLTNSSASSNNTISTSSNAIGSAGSLNSNTWGLNYENTGAYVGLPTYSDSTSKALTSKSDVEESSTVPIYYGIKVDTSITPGTYTGDVLYTVLMDSSCLAYTVVFDANGGSGTMDNQSIMAGTKTALDENSFTRDGYAFLGWSTKATGKTETAVDGVGTEADVDYADKAEVTDLTSGGNSITLYAIWGEEVEPMQSWKGCPSLTVGESVTLEDVRDNRKYAVKKLPDGKCWMVQNLALGMNATEKGLTLTPDDTNIDNGTTYYLPPAGKQGSSAIDDPSTLTATDAANFSSSNDNRAKTQFRVKDSNITNDSDTGYYNFYTVTLGFSSYRDGKTSGSSTRDICPKNWRLPKTTDSGANITTIGITNDFTYLALQYSNSAGWNGSSTGTSGSGYYNNDTAVQGPMYLSAASPLATPTQNNYAGFSYSGLIDGVSPSGAGLYGYYWSASVQGTSSGYYLYIYSSSIFPQRADYDKYPGFAARCVYDAYDTMQDFDASAFSDTVGDSTELKDTRDGKIYTVKRLPDGKVWMMQNLTIGMDGAKTLTPADTNIDNGTTYYLPPAGKQGYETIDKSSTLTVTTGAYFDASNDNRAKTQFRTKSSGYTNDSDTGYYNFYTATLGFSSYQDGKTSGSSTRDICPKNWRLPKTTDSGANVTTVGMANDFTYLALQYNSSTGWSGSATGTSGNGYYNDNAVAKDPIYLQAASPLATSTQNNYAGYSYAGYYINASLDRFGSEGPYWASSVFNTYWGYRLYFNSSSVRPQGSYDKYVGSAVRCVAQSSYTIDYSSDGATSGEPEKTTEGKVYENGSITLPSAGTMAKDGYAFKGWALTSGAADPAYAAGETVALSALLSAASSAGQSTTPGSTFTLYPVWKQVAYMQDWMGCSSLSAGNTVTLTDVRDGTEYRVKKFTDNGNCWMIDNLVLGYDKGYALTFADTNISDSGTYYIPKAGYQGTGLITDDSRNSATAATWTNNSSNDQHAKVQYKTAGSVGEQNSVSGYTLTQNTGYYNFYTATLGCSYYQDGLSNCVSGYATRDICPKGWQLPAGGSSATKSWVALDKELNGSSAGSNRTNATARDKFLNTADFFYSGYYRNSSLYRVGSSGGWWSSTVNDTNGGYRLGLNSDGYVYPQGSDGKYFGFAVRCVARIDEPYDGVMQDFDAGSFSTTVGTSTKLLDTRDYKVYTVKRLPDGKVWMMQNLTVNGVALTKDDTNIDNGTVYYLPKDGGAGSLTSTSTKDATAGYNFADGSDNQAMFKFRAKNSSYTNDSDTGYYNFYTATLGFSYHNDGKTSGSSTRDICPKGWRLPHTTDAGTTVSETATVNDFTYLAQQYGASGWQGEATSYSYHISSDSMAYVGLHSGIASPIATSAQNDYAGFSYAGSYNRTSPWNIGSSGYYWTSSVDSNYGYFLSFNSSDIYPQAHNYKYHGAAVRCAAK